MAGAALASSVSPPPCTKGCCTMYQISIDKTFAASHALMLPDGRAEPLHGHNWAVRVTVGADRLDAMQTVMDFHELERLVEAVIGPWRNRHLNDVPPFASASGVAASGNAEGSTGGQAAMKPGRVAAGGGRTNPGAAAVSPKGAGRSTPAPNVSRGGSARRSPGSFPNPWSW